MSRNPRNQKPKGNLGEGIAAAYLVNNGFTIIEKNYSRKTGELDLVATRDKELHFVEVKTFSRETSDGEGAHDRYRPEENVDVYKLKKVRRTAEYFLMEHSPKYAGYSPQIDVLAVTVDSVSKTAHCKFIGQVVL